MIFNNYILNILDRYASLRLRNFEKDWQREIRISVQSEETGRPSNIRNETDQSARNIRQIKEKRLNLNQNSLINTTR